MSNGTEAVFTKFVMSHVKSTPRDEASKLVLEGVQAGRSPGDAVADAIESLPAKKTLKLRRLVEYVNGYSEWLDYKKDGWAIERSGSAELAKRGERVEIYAPDETKLGDRPSDEAVAATAGAGEVSLTGKRENAMLVYVVTQAL